MKAMIQQRSGLRITLPQVLIMLGFAAGIWFLSSFSHMMEQSQTIRAQQSQLVATVTALHHEQVGLTLTQAYVSSDPFVERTLRTHLKYGLPGETHIVVITPAVETSQQTPLIYAEIPPPHTPNWLVWRTLFFAPHN